MAGRRICILIATIDAICLSIILDLLRSCTHEVLHMGGPIDTLTAICERKDMVGVILTNVHRIQSQVTTDILYHIQKKLRVHTCFMSPDDRKIELTEGANGGFAAYIVHSMDNIDLLSFWRMSSIKSTEVEKFVDITSHVMRSSFSSASASASGSASTSAASDAVGVDDDESEKGSRVLWIEEIERKFLKAIYTLPPRDVVPKKVLEHMGFPAGLKRKHISSHLQKHRLRVKKNAEAAKKNAEVTAPAPPMPYGGPYLRFGAQGLGLRAPNVSETRQAPLQNISDNATQQQTVEVGENDNDNARQQQQTPGEDDNENARQQPKREEDEDIDWHIRNFWDGAQGPPSLD